MSLNIETETAIDQNDPERFYVIERTPRFMRVLFGLATLAECQDFCQEELQARRDWDMEGR
jgi:hypothetical protein